MSGRPEGNGTQAVRVLRLFVQLLAAPGPVWLAELSAAHGVSERTVRRDLVAIREATRATHAMEQHGGAVSVRLRGSR